MTRAGVLLYRCRLCGRVGRNPRVPDVLLALALLAAGKPLPKEWGGTPVGATRLCACGDGRAGVAELVGGETDP